MNVLYINTCYYGGGAEKVTRQLYCGMMNKGVNTFFVAGRYQKYKPQNINVVYNDIFGRGITVALGALRHNVLKRTFRAKKEIIKIIKKEKIDIVHFHNIHGNYFGISDIEEIKKYCPNIVFTLHDMWLITGCCPYSMSCKMWEKKCEECEGNETLKKGSNKTSKYLKWKADYFSNNDFYFVSPSKWLYNLCRKSWLKDEKLYVIPNGVDITKYVENDKLKMKKKYHLPNDKRIILFSANKIDIPYKGVKFLYSALQMLEHKEKYCLLVVGNKGTANFPDGFEVIEKGYINNEKEMNELYSSADLFIIPSMAENFPLVVLESMASGTPVLTFKTGGIIEAVTDEVGWQVEKGDSKGLAEKIHLIFSDEKELNDKSMKCRKYVEKYFSEDLMIERYLDIYKEMLNRNK